MAPGQDGRGLVLAPGNVDLNPRARLRRDQRDLSSSDVSGVIKCSNEKSDKKMETSNVEMRNVHL